MSKLSLSRNQMKAVLGELNAGRTVQEVARRHGISSSTLYRWRANFAGKRQPVKMRLRLLEAEHRRLQKQFAELILDYTTLRAALMKDVKGDC